MSLILALALFLAAPTPAPATTRLPAAATLAITAWLEAQREQGRVLELVGEDAAQQRPSATFLDRTGGCPRGWVRVTMAATPSTAAPQHLDEYLGAPCSGRPEPLNHLMRLLEAEAHDDRHALARFVPPGAQFPIGLEQGRVIKRSTHDREQVLAGKVRFPRCDPAVDRPSCDPPTPDPTTGTVKLRCRCVGAHTVTYELRALAPEHDPQDVQLVSIDVR